MNQPLEDKNMVYWNDQALDTWQDIIISFEYARFAIDTAPSGGFAIVFFDSISDSPRGGGRDYSLGYTPNDGVDYCSQGGYNGLQSAFLGIGFDPTGFFAIQQSYVTGLPVSSVDLGPTLAVRGGVDTDYSVLYYSSLNKLISGVEGAKNFQISQNVSSIDSAKYQAVRIILGKSSTELKIQVKDDNTNDTFVTIAQIAIPLKDRTALKVGLTHTTAEGATMFRVRNFNVAGYPGAPTTRRLANCSQMIRKNDYGLYNNILAMGDEFITTAEYRKVLTYTSDTIRYKLSNIITTGSGITLFGDDSVSIIARVDNSPQIVVYRYLGEKTARVQPTTVNRFITPDNQIATSADIAGGTLAICTPSNNGTAYIYAYNRSSANLAQYGTWSLYQTLNGVTDVPSGSATSMGVSVQISGRNMLVGDINLTVHAFRKDINENWTYIQTLSCPIATTGNTRFGSIISLEGDDAVIGAPNCFKEQYRQPGQGEAFHFVYESGTGRWRHVMSLGSFYDINTPNGNFGTSIKLYDNYCAIGAPFEPYREDPNSNTEVANVGRVYVFQKTKSGIFSQANVIAPGDDIRQQNMGFGAAVSIYGNLLAVLSPYEEIDRKSYLSIYRLDCRFTIPPLHVPIPPCALRLSDDSGFIIDLINNDYMVSVSCELGYPTFMPDNIPQVPPS